MGAIMMKKTKILGILLRITRQ